MPRSRTIRRSPKSSNEAIPILPEALQAFIARRLMDLMAGLFVLLGLYTLLALSSYTPADPSWNTAAPPDIDVYNLGGRGGAFIADLLIQPFGLAGGLFGFGLCAMGARLLARHATRSLALRLGALIVSIFAGALAIATQPLSSLPHGYAGGALGTILNSALLKIVWLPTFVVQPAAMLISVTAFLYATCVTRAEITAALTLARALAIAACIALINAAIAFRNWIAHYNDPNYVTKPLFKFNIALPKKELPKALQTAAIAPTAQEALPSAASIAQAMPTTPAPAPQATSDIPVVKPKAKTQTNNQTSFNLDGGDWELPSIDLLTPAPPAEEQGQLDEDALRKNAQLLRSVLADFKVEGEIASIHPGPVVTLYEFEPAPGTKSARVISLSDDIARSMAAISVRCAVVPGRNVIGIEIPNKTRQFVYMQELLATNSFEKTKHKLPLILGKDIGGAPIMADLAKMPHLLVAGTTGSGKSVAVNTMILSLLYRLPPEKCRMIMIDPKMLELSVYDDIPHLLSPVVTEPGKAIVALKWAVAEMENRYRAMSKLGVRNIEGYNDRMRDALKKGEEITERIQTGFDETGAPTWAEQPMDLAEIPYIVVIVDEFADLMLVAGKDVENAIQRLAQMARAAGIHLIMATQRPSVDVITGVVKANFPTRISFQVTSKIDSRTILGDGGAEQLLGMGDMLYMAPGGRITRVHGPFVSDEDVEKVVDALKAQGQPAYLDDVTDEEAAFGDSEVMNAMFSGSGNTGSGGSDVDELYDQAVAIVAREGKASTSFIQRHLQIGYNRAARIVEEMERQGVISPANATGKRTVLVGDYSDVG